MFLFYVTVPWLDQWVVAVPVRRGIEARPDNREDNVRCDSDSISTRVVHVGRGPLSRVMKQIYSFAFC